MKRKPPKDSWEASVANLSVNPLVGILKWKLNMMIVSDDKNAACEDDDYDYSDDDDNDDDNDDDECSALSVS